MRIVRTAVVGLLGLLLMLALLAVWAVTTQTGTRVLLAQVVLPFTPVRVSGEDIHGRLVGSLALNQVEVALEDGRVDVARMELRWRPAHLLRGVVHLERLQIVGARVTLADEERTRDTTTGNEPRANDDEEPPEWSLPVRIRIARLEIRDAAVLQGAEPLVTDLAALLSLEAQDEAVWIPRLEARSDQGGVEGHISVSSAAGGAWDVDLRWRWMLVARDAEELRGRFRARGVLADLELDLAIGGLLDGALSARVQGLPAEASWNAEIVVEPLPQRPRFWPATVDGAAGRLSGQGTLDNLMLQGGLSLPQLIPGDVVVQGRLGWAADALELGDVLIELEHGGRMAGQGLVTLGSGLQAALAVTAEDLRWPTDAEDPQLRVPRLRLELQGDARGYAVDADALLQVAGLPDAELALLGNWRDSVLTLEQLRFEADEVGIFAVGDGVARITAEGIRYEFDVDGALRRTEWPELRFRAAGRGDPGQVRLERLLAEGLDGELAGGGTLDWTDGVQLDFAWRAQDVDPGVHWPMWPGRLGGEVRLRGEILREQELSVSVSALEGNLRGRALRGGVDVRLLAEGLEVTRGELRLGETWVEGRGQLGPERLDLALTLVSPDLQDLHPAARGALTASGTASGVLEAPAMSLRLEGSELGWPGLALDTIVASVQLDLQDPQHDARLALELSGLNAEEHLLDTLALTGSGTRAAHRVQLSGTRATAHWSLDLQGALAADQQWTGNLETFLLGLHGETMWRLRAPAPLSASAEHAQLSKACLDGDIFGETCIAARWHGEEGWEAGFDVADLNLHFLGEWLGAELVAQGRVAGQVDLRGGPEGFEQLAGDITLGAGSLAPTGFPDEPLLAWHGSSITLSGDPVQAIAEAHVDLAERGGIEGSLRIGWNEDDPPVEGRLVAELTQPELITIFIPDLARLEGRVSAAVNLGGTLAQPVLLGELSWEEGAASVPVVGTRAHDISLRATVSDEDGIRFTAFARAGEGELFSEGSFALAPLPFSGEARLWGTDALVVNLPGIQVLASPELTLSYREDRIAIVGEVQLPAGRITDSSEPAAPEQVAEVSPDEVVAGAEGDEVEEVVETPEAHFDIRLRLGPNFLVDTEGLEAEIEGDVRVIQIADGEPIGRGEVYILDGSFTLFDQPLIIGEGRLVFSETPLENPALDLQAELTTEDVFVGALIRGSLVEPEVTLFTEPPMPEAEALSYLITGRGLHDLHADETKIVHSAANSMMMAGAELLGRQVGTRLGFDAMGVTGGAQPGSADLVIGLHLGSRLFVSYGVGLYEAVSAMRVRYRLARRWALEVISGDVSSADLMSTLER